MMPKTAEFALCSVETQVSNSMLVVTVSEKSVGEVITCTLDHIDLI